MPRRTIALFIVIALITALLVFAAFSQLKGDRNQADTNKSTTNNEKAINPTQLVKKTVSLSFSPSEIQSTGGLTRADIIADTGGSEIAGIQVELQYDPKKITNVTILPATTNSLFGKNGQELIKEVRQDAGRISYAIVIDQTAPEVKGIGNIATLQFQALQGTSGSTQITFLERSLATTLKTQQSLLKGTVPLTISVTPSTSSAIQNPQNIQPTLAQ